MPLPTRGATQNDPDPAVPHVHRAGTRESATSSLANLSLATASKRSPRLIHGCSTAATMRGALVSDRSGADLLCRSDEHLVSARAGLPLRGKCASRQSAAALCAPRTSKMLEFAG